MPGAVDPFHKEFDVAHARILVADDHEEVRNTIVRLLRRRFEVLAALDDGPIFLEAVARLKPDLCVLDISMPNMSGIEVARRIKRDDPRIRIVFLTLHDDFDFRAAALETGAEGYVTKAKMGGDLLLAVREVLAGRRWFSRGERCDVTETHTD
ncbi:MAG TPA: response regulator transcription factor [Pyrinomonadaceae bacterium]|nr:response regulator transcription factor [Pyrinomonadaceae bacterium]